MTQVSVLDQAISAELLSLTHKDVARCRFSYGWRSNPELGFGHWNDDILNSGIENKEDLSSRLRLASRLRKIDGIVGLWSHFSRTILAGHNLLRCYINAYTFGTEGYPHKDTPRPGETTTVVYMNPEWKKEWAGETVLFDESGEIAKAILPRYGRVVLFPSDMEHCARAVSRSCPELRITLLFKSRPHDAP